MCEMQSGNLIDAERYWWSSTQSIVPPVKFGLSTIFLVQELLSEFRGMSSPIRQEPQEDKLGLSSLIVQLKERLQRAQKPG